MGTGANHCFEQVRVGVIEMRRPLSSSLLIFGISLSAAAQETQSKIENLAAPAAEKTTEATSQKDTQKIERVEVTGSHIRRVDVEGVSPVTTVTRKDIEKTGYNSVSDVLRDLSSSSFGSTREASGSNSAGVAEVDLRGLGSSNTLVLLDGQRLPPDAISGAVDLNLIPMAAVERIDVLKDGASAIYGSDALGGVVNIITRKDFAGTQLNVSQLVPELKGGQKQEVSIVNGQNFEKLNVVTVLQYRNNSTVYSRDRSWSDNGYSNIGSPGSYQNTGGSWIADPNCPASQKVTTPDGVFCRFKYSDYSTELPGLDQLSLLSQANYEASSDLKIYGRMGATRKHVTWSYAPAPGTFTVPGSVADTLGSGGTPLPGATAGQPLNIRYRLTDLGTRDSDIVTNAYNFLVGGTLQLSKGWQLDLTTAHNIVWTKDVGVSGYALTSDLTSAIQSGSFNPFGSGAARGSISNLKYMPVEESMSQLSSIEAKASGDIAELPAGPVGLAIGTTLTHMKYEDNFDDNSVNNNVFGNAGSSGGGGRETQAAYTEFSIPVLKQLEMQVAARYDRYSDFGDTVNPKVGLLYHASKDLLVRGSVGTGFKAPLMQDLYAATSSGYPTFIDWVACNAERKAGGATPSCQPQQYPVTSGGNKGLSEERAISYNLGVVYDPTPEWSLSTDGFVTQTKNVVGIDYSDAMLAASKGVNLANYGVIVSRDSNGYITNIVSPLQNLSSQDVAGVDVSVAYKLAHYRFGTEHSHLLFFKEEGFPGAGKRDKLGESGRPQWRNATSGAYLPDDRSEYTLVAMTIAVQSDYVESQGSLATYTTLDGIYTFKTKTIGKFSAQVKNIFGTTPPLDTSSASGSQLNTSLYDQIGRQLIAGYQYNF